MIRLVEQSYSVEEQGMTYIYELGLRFPRYALYLGDSESTGWYSFESDAGTWIENYIKKHPVTARYAVDNFVDSHDTWCGSWHVYAFLNSFACSGNNTLRFCLSVSQSLMLCSQRPYSSTVAELFDFGDREPVETPVQDYKYMSEAVQRLDATLLQVYIQNQMQDRTITGKNSREIFQQLDDRGYYVSNYDRLDTPPRIDRYYTLYSDPKEDFNAYMKFQEYLSRGEP